MAESNLESDAASDHSLLARVKRGQDDAATALYLRYAEHLRALAAKQSSPALASRYDPEDIVQSVFRTFFRRVARDQYEVPRGEDLWKLFLVIALNKIRNAAIHHKAAKRDVRLTVGLADLAPVSEPSRLADGGDLAVLQMVVDEELADLPESTRRIIQLRIEGHDIASIAQQSGRSRRSVERVLQQFRTQLRGLLDGIE